MDEHLSLTDLNDRSREIFRRIVESYLETGEPVGSRTLARALNEQISPATIRNVMSDLEYAGLLFAPHTSAGRLPTDAGLRLFVSGLLEVGGLTKAERKNIEANLAPTGVTMEAALNQATEALSGLSQCAGIVMAPKADAILKHIEFVHLSPGRALVVLVYENGDVENRLLDIPADMRPSALTQASNFLSAHMCGKTLGQAKTDLTRELELRRSELDGLTAKLVQDGMAIWGGDGADGALIVKGQSNLLNDVQAVEDLERIRVLFSMLETREEMVQVLDLVQGADGVQIFIGAENKMFASAGCSMVVAPYSNGQEDIVGAIGVIGPTRMNYGRIIPLVDYTAKVIGDLMAK